jgi:diguanylate cyclase (GGDEF)-like protein
MDSQILAELESLRQHKQRLERDVERLLTIDQLTGLLNRNAFTNRTNKLLNQPEVEKTQAAMIEFSIVGLPRISGSLGRHATDYLLSALAARMALMLADGLLAARLDYKSFAVFLPAIADPLYALTEARRILTKLREPVDWVDRKLSVDVMAGVALATANERHAEVLLENASLACRSAGQRGGPGYAFFNPALAENTRRRTEIQTAIQDGIEHNYFFMHYQPIFDCANGNLTGFEALLRLNHPKLGAISPAEFIPAAESSGQIGKLGSFALVTATRAASQWPADTVIAVNVSPEQFLDGSLITDIHNALELSTIPAYRLEIEITESTMMADVDVILPQIQALRELGCAVVLDDFGTGYSSLSYLWKFPFTKLKIDRSFVQAADTQPKVRGLISAIMDLSRNLGLKVTAEGIETPVQAAMIQACGCNFIQGYLTGRPVPDTDVAAIVMKRFAEAIRPQQTDIMLPGTLARRTAM